MAEIKSTMDLVMERAARMGMATPDEMRHEENLKKGMQFTAEYLNGTQDSLSEILGEQEPAHQEDRKGMLSSLLRNLFLPRDEDGIKRIELAVQGIVALNKGTGDIAALCQELQTITSQYGQHRNQLYDQLKEQMRMQIEQMIARKTGMKPDSSKIDPTAEPQFKEQWTRLEADLEGQYGQALEQFKAQLKEWTGA